MSMQRISLKDLVDAPHLLLPEGAPFNDPEVTETLNIDHMMNIDGVCLLSRYNLIVISHKKFTFTFYILGLS